MTKANLRNYKGASAMTKIKIISNPYMQDIQYLTYNENSDKWIDVGLNSPNSKLREETAHNCFLPFNAKEIIEIIINEYYLSEKDPVGIVFEGTKEEYNELSKIVRADEFKDKVVLTLSNQVLNGGEFVLKDTKEIFTYVKPVIEKVSKDELSITKNLAKVADALDDIVPICVFGNCSSGKSTFINALIGCEILPSGDDPITAKAFKIQNSTENDVALIKFSHLENHIELCFDKYGYHLVSGDADDVLLTELNSIFKEQDETNINKMVYSALDFINAYERQDCDIFEISNLIEVYIPFSKTGIIGNSENKFVIFDTPGSNTATNFGHIKALKEALDGFSNGIPVWVSSYETLDSTDNEALCKNILGIDALDKRFTMIVLNKADISNLPEDGFSNKQVKIIREFKSVEKMYSSGIFFVSSIMGLGAKNGGVFSDKHYRRIYKMQNDCFSDPDDEDYIQLYKYNIMPPQIKEDVIEYSSGEDNLMYVNSGFHCIETEMEEFATKYSTYNKCQMVYALLKDVVEKTTDKIDKKVQKRKERRRKFSNELEDKRQNLLETMSKKCEELDKLFTNDSYNSINAYAKNNLDYDYPLEQLEELNKKYIEENTNQYNIENKKKSLDNAKGKMLKGLKDRVKEFSLSDFSNSMSGIVEETKKGFENISDSKKELESTRKSASTETVDEVLHEVIETYKSSIADAAVKINHIACNYWANNSEMLKNELIKIVTESDALTDDQKQNLSNIIFNYKNIPYDDQANNIFVKPKFLQGRLLGIDLFTFERLNTNKLAREYNRTVAEKIESIATTMDENYHNSYKIWQDELNVIIEKNIIELNPDLQFFSEEIENITAEIQDLEICQLTIKNSLNEIRALIS